MRRRKLLVALAGLAVVVAAGAVVLWPRVPRVTLENGNRILRGMSRAEVIAILGPPGDYTTGPGIWKGTEKGIWIDQTKDDFPETPGGQVEGWWGDTAVIRIAFSRNRVAYVYMDPFVKKELGPLENFLWRIGLR
jgi:hypothetical protein